MLKGKLHSIPPVKLILKARVQRSNSHRHPHWRYNAHSDQGYNTDPAKWNLTA